MRDIALVGLAASDPAQRRLEAAFAQAGIQPRFVIETPYSATQCSLVLAGAGLAVTNPLVAREYVAMGLRCVHFVAGVSFRALLAFKPRQAQSGAAQEFVALCRRYLSNGLPAGPVPDTP